MKQLNINKSGYKKTKVGWLPKEWSIKKGKQLAIKITKGSSPKWQGFNYQNNGILFITSENVRDGYLDVSYPKYLPNEFNNKQKNSIVKYGDLLINIVGSIGRSCKYILKDETANINQAVCIFRIPDNVLSDFLYYYFQLNTTIRRLISTQTDSARPNLTLFDIGNFDFCIPPDFEQMKIIQILKVFDKSINQNVKLIYAKIKFKNGLMQKLLSGQVRFTKFRKPSNRKNSIPNEWQNGRLGEYFSQREETNPDLPLLSITSGRGVIPREEVERKDISNVDKSKYKRIVPGDIGYNTMRMWQGVSALSSLEGIVSPAYTVCIPKKGHVSNFYKHLFKNPHMIHLFHRYSQGLVDDTLNLKFHNFSQIKVTVPSEIEQKQIANVLNVCDREIELLSQKMIALKKQKQVLMHKLLSGEIRVKLTKK
jgi:type I restriction enzyme S subunit